MTHAQELSSTTRPSSGALREALQTVKADGKLSTEALAYIETRIQHGGPIDLRATAINTPPQLPPPDEAWRDGSKWRRAGMSAGFAELVAVDKYFEAHKNKERAAKHPEKPSQPADNRANVVPVSDEQSGATGLLGRMVMRTQAVLSVASGLTREWVVSAAETSKARYQEAFEQVARDQSGQNSTVTVPGGENVSYWPGVAPLPNAEEDTAELLLPVTDTDPTLVDLHDTREFSATDATLRFGPVPPHLDFGKHPEDGMDEPTLEYPAPADPWGFTAQ